MSREHDDATEHHWRARPVLAGALRTVLLSVPLLASSAAVLLLSRWLPPGTSSRWWGLALLLLTAVGVAMAVERATRRLLPIALLLKLSMIFPDRAPSRFKLARAAAVRPPGHELLWEGTDSEPTSTADLVLNLVAALGTHDRRTRGHSERVRLLCDMLAEELKLDDDARDRLRWSSLLHDVGKMKVSTSILNKPGRLDAKEFDRIKQHPAAGAELAAPLLPWLGEWGDGIVDHHEKYDGTGYPAGKSGAQISTAGRLIGLIDAFETMTAARPYKKAMATKAAREELARCAGTHFDPLMVRAFLAISLPRVLWAMGPLSFLLQLPFLRPLADAGVRTGVVAPQAAASALASGAASAVLVSSGLGGITGPATTGAAELLGAPELRSSQGAAPYNLQDRVTPPPAVSSAQPEAAGTNEVATSGTAAGASSGSPSAVGAAAEQPEAASGSTADSTVDAELPTDPPRGPRAAETPPTSDEPVDDEPVDDEPVGPSGPDTAEQEPPEQQPEDDEQPAVAPDDPTPVTVVLDPGSATEPPPPGSTPAPAPGGVAAPEPTPSASSGPAAAEATPAPGVSASDSPEPEPAPTTGAGAGPGPDPGPTTNPQVSAGILDGPADVVDTRTITFTFAPGTAWECQ
ncbi:MAG: HD domain-containing protein, partial [Frankiales bacterium]